MGNVSMHRKAYVCAPYSADLEIAIDANIRRAIDYAEAIYKLGYIPITPHVLFSFIKNEESEDDRKWAVKADLEILKMCDVLFICGDKVTRGMKKEIQFAKKIGLQIKRISDEEELKHE